MSEKQMKALNTMAMLYGFVILIAILTWIIPGGEYARVEQNGRMIVVADSFRSVAANPQGFAAIILAPILGFIRSAKVAMFLIFIGGSFALLDETKAIIAAIQRLAKFFGGHKTLKKLFIPVTMIVFSLGGATFGMSEETIAFIPIFVTLAIFLGYDTIVGVAIPFLGAGAGFAGAFINPFTIGVAQGIAQLPPRSGFNYRLVVWVISTVAMIIFVMMYANKIDKDPTKSVMYEEDKERRKNSDLKNTEFEEFTQSRKLVLGLFIVAMGVLVFGVLKYEWYINEIGGLFLCTGLVAAIVSRFSIDKITQTFTKGAQSMMGVVLLLALANGILVIAENGKILDSILHWVSSLVSGAHPIIGSQLMFGVQTFINFFVPSGSGQAALTMPIMTPLADLLNISRQTAVLAFQFGDGWINTIIPTSGVTMGVLGMAGIPYQKWFKWLLPMQIVLVILSLILLIPPYFIWH
jgi:uncharacterized ion transporter superfamily protein YfcC